MALPRGPGRGRGEWISDRGVVIGDPGFIAKLAAVLGVPRGGRGYPQEITDLGIVIAIDAGQVLSAAQRISVTSMTDELQASDTELTLGPITQASVVTQLNEDLTAGIAVGVTYEVFGISLWFGLQAPVAGDQAEIAFWVDNVARAVIPSRGNQTPGYLVGRDFLVNPDRVFAVRDFVFPGTRKQKRLGTSAGQGGIAMHTQVTNRRTSVGSINVFLGGAIYFRPST